MVAFILAHSVIVVLGAIAIMGTILFLISPSYKKQGDIKRNDSINKEKPGGDS